MDAIDIAAPQGERKRLFFARSMGTSFDVRASTDATEIDLYDEIGFWGTTAKDFRDRINGAGDIVLKINSPGGDVFDGISIYNDLLAHPGRVRVEITGLAASIASIIALAGDEVAIAENGFFMIHNAWTIALGNRHQLADVVSLLGKIDDALARTYVARTSIGIRSVKQMMDDETWMTGKEARENGFATEILGAEAPKARFDLSLFANAPKALAWDESEPEEFKTIRDVERRAMRDAGWSRSTVHAAIRVIKRSEAEPQRDAGEADLTHLAAALMKARLAARC